MAGKPATGPGFYLPPEADVIMPASPSPTPVREEPPPPAPPPPVESTQVITPVGETPPPPLPAGPRQRTAVCPECYAVNPESNSFCHECGSPLPSVAAARQATGARSDAAGRGRTMVLPVDDMEAAAEAEKYARDAQADYERPARGGRSFGMADVLALFAVVIAAVALLLPYVLDSFTWKKGVDMGVFSHQGAFSPDRYDLPGGPGILPYGGSEFLTVGLIVGVGMALAALFLLLRVGRGPMFMLAGCLHLLPMAYVVFCGLLPITVKVAQKDGVLRFNAVGVKPILFGGNGAPGLGPPIWLMVGAGVLLVLAGFAAPPRRWGRLFTFFLFFAVMLGIAFLCAACYNWNLFIPAQEAGLLLARPQWPAPLGYAFAAAF